MAAPPRRPAQPRVRAEVPGPSRASASVRSSTGSPPSSGSAAGCSTTSAASCWRSRARPRRSTTLLARLRSQAPPLAVIESVRVQAAAPTGERDFRILESDRGGPPDAPVSPDFATCAECVAELFDPGRPALSLSVHQLHQLRPALLDRHRRALRPPADDDGRVRDVRALPGRVRGPARPPLSRPAERLPRMRAAGAAHRPRRRARGRRPRPGRGGRRDAARRGRSSRSRASAAITSPASPPTSARSRRCGSASTASRSRSR